MQCAYYSNKRKINQKLKNMDAQKVDMFLMTNAKFFESHQINSIRERLLAIDDSKWPVISTIQFNDPTTILIVSILAGSLGIDRFMIGDTGIGVGKLVTCGGLGIWTIIDWFMIQGATREKNFIKIQQFLY
jgi:TM2 domain-containing membrane protein YozV